MHTSNCSLADPSHPSGTFSFCALQYNAIEKEKEKVKAGLQTWVTRLVVLSLYYRWLT